MLTPSLSGEVHADSGTNLGNLITLPYLLCLNTGSGLSIVKYVTCARLFTSTFFGSYNYLVL